jgi:hypothetical protein
MKNALLFLLTLLLTQVSLAQSNEPSRQWEAGFLFSLDYGYLKLDPSPQAGPMEAGDVVNLVEARNDLGFSLGIHGRYHLSPSFALVPQAILSFQNSLVFYDFELRPNHEETIAPVTIDLPLHVVFTQRTKGRAHPSFMLGGRYVWNISSQTDDIKLNADRNDWAIDLGIGLEVNTRWFNLKPELLYSLGLVNLREGEGDPFKDTVNTLYRDKIGFRLLLYR